MKELVKEMILEDLPKPGEPLTYQIDENNQKLLDLSLEERLSRQTSKLGRWELFKLRRRYNQLRDILIRKEYNSLITRRFECFQQYEELKHLLKTNPTKATYETFKQVVTRGKLLNTAVNDIKVYSDEFDRINTRLKAHKQYIEWEREDRENFRAFLNEARTWEAQLKAAFVQSPRLHHRGEDSNGREYTDIPNIREILVKDDRVLYHIKTTGQSLIERWFGRWHSALPYGVDISALISDETLQNLSAMCNRKVTVERSQRGTNLFYVISRLDSPNGIPTKVLYRNVMQWYPAEDHTKTPFCMGVTNDRKLQWYTFEDLPHVLIGGATQGGKSNFINQMIACITSMNTPTEVRLLLVDLKGGIEFTHWKYLQHQVKPMLTTASQVYEGLHWLRTLMERRLVAFEALKAKNFLDYNNKAKNKLPRLICFFDEMATLISLGSLTQDIHNEIRILTAQGRAVGIHCVIATQHPSVEVLPNVIKTNMSLRISAKMPSHTSSQVILDTITAVQIDAIAGRMVASTGRNEIIVQSAYISDIEIENAIIIANDFAKADETEFVAQLAQPDYRFTRDDCLEIVINRCKGIISAARVHDVVNDNEIVTLRELRNITKRIISDAKADGGLMFRGLFYDIRKERNFYVLEQTDIKNLNGHNAIEIPGKIVEVKGLRYEDSPALPGSRFKISK